jgi:hypothetical protein
MAAQPIRFDLEDNGGISAVCRGCATPSDMYTCAVDICTKNKYKIEFEVDMGNLSGITNDDLGRVHSMVLFSCRDHESAVRKAAAGFMKESGYIKSVDSSGDIAYMRAVRAWEIAVQDHIQTIEQNNWKI